MGSVVEMKPDETNVDIKKVQDAIEQIEKRQEKIDDINAAAKEKNAPHRDAIKAIKQKARDEFGIEAKALNTKLAARKNERRIAARVEALPERASVQYSLL